MTYPVMQRPGRHKGWRVYDRLGRCTPDGKPGFIAALPKAELVEVHPVTPHWPCYPASWCHYSVVMPQADAEIDPSVLDDLRRAIAWLHCVPGWLWRGMKGLPGLYWELAPAEWKRGPSRARDGE